MTLGSSLLLGRNPVLPSCLKPGSLKNNNMETKHPVLSRQFYVLQVKKLLGPAKLRAVFAMKMRNASQEQWIQVANNPKLHSKLKKQNPKTSRRIQHCW